MRVKLQYFKAQLKKAFKYFPQLLVGSIFLALLAGLFAYAAISFQTKESDEPIVHVALVTNNNEAYLDYAMGIITQMNSVKDLFAFDIVQEDEGYALLESGDVIALFILPDSMVEGILSGKNTHARIILSDKDPLSGVLMQEIVKAGSSLITSSQASIYTAIDVYNNYELYEAETDIVNFLNAIEISTALSRNSIFANHSLSETGYVDYPTFYLCAAFVFVLLISGASYIMFYSRGVRDLQLKRKSAGIGCITCALSSYTSTFLYQFFLNFLLYIGLNINMILTDSFSLLDSLSILFLLIILTFASSSFLFFLLSISPESPISVIVLFLITGSMMLISGCFIPSAFLPDGIRMLGSYMPSSHMQYQLFHVLSYSNPLSSDMNISNYKMLIDDNCLKLIITGIIFFIPGLLSFYIADKKGGR